MARQNSQADEIEELLQIAEAKPEVKVKFEDTEVEQFIHECKIVKGETKVPTQVIYLTYTEWRKKKKLKHRNHFFIQFKKHFENKLIEGGQSYLLNPEPFDLTQEGYFRAMKQLRRERYERKKKNKKK